MLKKILTKTKDVFSVLTKNGRTIAVYMFVLLIVKQFVVFGVYREQFFGKDFGQIFYSYLGIISSDLMIFSIVLILVITNFSIKIKFLKIIFNIFNFLIIILFSVDVFVNYFFKSRLTIQDIFNFINYSNSDYFDAYLIPIIWIFVSFFLIIFYVVQNYIKYLNKLKIFVYFFIVSLTLWLLSLLNYYFFGNTFDENIFTLNANKIIEGKPTASDESELKLSFANNLTKKYKDNFRYINWQNKKLNVILIFAESLSAIDSFKVSWINNRFPNIDKIQSEWKMFTNFIANWYTSDTAHVALLRWVEPWNNPQKEINKFYEIYKSYTISLPEFLNNLGYKTIFLSAVTLDFFDQKNFLSWIKFDEIIWDEQFINEKKYVFDAAPDKVLYDKALKIISQLQGGSWNYFLNLQTISSHKPYNTPYWNTLEDAYRYTDESLYYFYQNLINLNFFDDWILIIVADHRKMENIENDELTKYWLSANGRWILAIVWSWISSWKINDEIIQHTDIFYSIKYLLWWEKILTSSKYNNIFTDFSNRDRWVVYCHFCPFKKYVIVKKNWISYQAKSLDELLEKNDKNIFDYIESYYDYQL